MAKQYLVGVQLKYQEKSGEYYNLKALLGTMSKGRYYSSLTTARKELKEYIAQANKRKAHTSTTYVGGIGVSVELTEKDIAEEKVVRWYIKKRTVSPWEEVDSYEVEA